MIAYDQIDMFSVTKPKYKITKPIRLVEDFAGVGSQAQALKNIGANFEHHRVIENDKYAMKSYNAIHETNFATLDITKINGSELGIVETDKYDYIMTYSFPCQDLSIAGKGAGMKKGSDTRSGLLWEVEYLLSDLCGFKEHRVPPRNSKYLSTTEWVDDYNYDIDKSKLPQILLMENVPQVIGKKNLKDFMEWQLFLEKLGYSNYFELLNAKDYSIPQNRNRCYMISILGDYYYQFPRKQKLKYRLKDFLEDEVDEKYYLSDKMIEGMKNTNFESYKLENKLLDKNGIASTIISRFEGTPQCIKDTNTTICINSKVNGKQPSLQDRVYDSEGISPAITTSFMPSIAEPAVLTPKRNEYGKEIRKKYEAGEIVESRHKMTDLMPRDDGICNTLTSVQKDNYVLVPEATKKGYVEAHEGDGVYINRPHQKRGVVQKGMIQTIKTSVDDIGVVVKDETVTILKLRQLDKNIYIDEFNRAFIKVDNVFYRIRKLTPKECFRLTGFRDEDFDKASKVNSNAQLYKQAGNSIVVPVLEAIFKELIE